MSETRVVMITPHWDEPADDRAMAARALACAYAAAGVRTTVLCPDGHMKPVLRSRVNLDIRRLEMPRPGATSFGVSALKEAWSLERRGTLTALECVDDPQVTIMAKFASIAGLLSAPVIHVRVSAAVDARDQAADAIADGLHVFDASCTDRADADVIAMPGVADLWRSPGVERCFVIPTSLPESHHKEIASAFSESRGGAKDWTLAVAGPSGRWIMADTRSSGADGDCVTIVGAGAITFPGVGLQAIAAGALALIHAASPLAASVPSGLRSALIFDGSCSLAAAMNRVVDAKREDRRRWARELAASVASPSAVQSKVQLWRDIERSHDPAAVARVWRLVERDCSFGMHVMETHR